MVKVSPDPEVSRFGNGAYYHFKNNWLRDLDKRYGLQVAYRELRVQKPDLGPAGAFDAVVKTNPIGRMTMASLLRMSDLGLDNGN